MKGLHHAGQNLGTKAATYDSVPPYLATKVALKVAMSPLASRCKMKARRPPLQPKAQCSEEHIPMHSLNSEPIPKPKRKLHICPTSLLPLEIWSFLL